MKLQCKAWALVLIIVAIGSVGIGLGARYLVGESFDRLEHERAEREGERARRVLNQQHQALTATARDYSYWIDAVQFMTGTRPSFLTDNFDTENLGYLGVSEVVVFDVTGEVHASVAPEGEDGLREVAGPTGRVLAGRRRCQAGAQDLAGGRRTTRAGGGVCHPRPR